MEEEVGVGLEVLVQVWGGAATKTTASTASFVLICRSLSPSSLVGKRLFLLWGQRRRPGEESLSGEAYLSCLTEL